MRKHIAPIFVVTASVLYATVAFGEPGKGYAAKLSKDWAVKTELKNMTVWGHVSQPSATISAISHSTDQGGPADGAKTLQSSSPLNDLESFSKSRAEKLQKIGIRDWETSNASNATLSGGISAVQLEGTYLGPSGATYCFVERQAKLPRRLLQLTATTKKNGVCGWKEMTIWLDQIAPHK